MPLLMIPGPIEISDAVAEAAGRRPPSHVAPDFVATFGRALSRMREVWRADPASQPFAVSGGGTLAMESVATNLVDPGERVLVVNTGYFSDRMAEMLRRRGAEVTEVGAAPGGAPSTEEVARAAGGGFVALFATHVDTSTGVRVDAEGLCRVAAENGLLSVFDGVCATAGERFEMAEWGADVYLSASQKALGLPPGLALWVASERALAKRSRLKVRPPMALDWDEWRPILVAYEEGRAAYFSTPATSLGLALDVALGEILDIGVPDRIAQHARAADALRGAWEALGLRLVAGELSANTLSALYYPEGVDASLVGRIREHGVIVAGGLHPEIKQTYFRVGHMGRVVTEPESLARTVTGIARALGREPPHLA